MKITKLHLKNYKSIKNLTVDFKKTSKNIKNLIALYGENGAGKTNIVDALKNLCMSLITMESYTKWSDIMAKQAQEHDNNFSEVDLKNIPFFHDSQNINKVFKNAHMINEKDNTEIIYYFDIEGKEGTYKITLSSKNELICEKLEFIIEKRKGVLFELKRDEITNDIFEKYNRNLITDRALKNDLKKEVRRFWGKHSFLSIINFNIQNENFEKNYLLRNISSNLINVIKAFKNISFHAHNVERSYIYTNILNNFSDGILENTEKNRNRIKNTEKLLNEIIPQLIPRVSRIEYDIKNIRDTKSSKRALISYEMSLRKIIGGKIRDIKFSYESDGTKNVINILPLLLNAITGKLVIIDEIDNGIHDLLMEGIIESFKEHINGQLIFTTHDTLLMQKLSKYNVYLINVNSNGNKECYSLDEFPIKDNEHENKTKQYLDGKFDAIPYIDNINFNSIESILKE